MNFLKVWTELDDGRFKSLPAKIVSRSKGSGGSSSFKIQYLSPTNKRTVSGKRIYAYETDTYEITDESIVQQVESELTLGFEELHSLPGNFIKFDIRDMCGENDEDQEDEDYVPESSSPSDGDDDSESSDWSSSDYIDDDASGEGCDDQESEDDDDGYYEEE